MIRPVVVVLATDDRQANADEAQLTGSEPPGAMFWFTRNAFLASYRRLSAVSRGQFGPKAACTRLDYSRQGQIALRDAR